MELLHKISESGLDRVAWAARWTESQHEGVAAEARGMTWLLGINRKGMNDYRLIKTWVFIFFFHIHFLSSFSSFIMLHP